MHVWKQRSWAYVGVGIVLHVVFRGRRFDLVLHCRSAGRVRLLANGMDSVVLLLLVGNYKEAHVLKVLIADDHAVIRQGLRRFLTSTGDITIVEEAATASEVLAHLGQHACDVLLMDLSLGHTSAFEVMSAVKALRPHLPIVIFTLHEEPAYIKAAWRRGATGYVVKTRPLSELVTALRYAARGTKYASPTLDDMTAPPLALAGKPLSRRQKQILLLRGQGQHAAQIGAALGITAKTVSAHEDKILEKLQLHSRHELLPYAARQAIVEQNAMHDVDSTKTVGLQPTMRESSSQ